MTTLVLPAPSVNPLVAYPLLGDPELVNGFDISGATLTSLATFNAFAFTWEPNVMFIFQAPSSNTATLTFVHPTSAALNYTTGAITAAHLVAFGPIQGLWCGGQSGLTNVTNGLVTVTITGTITGATVGVFTAPVVGASHNPFEMGGGGKSDF